MTIPDEAVQAAHAEYRRQGEMHNWPTSWPDSESMGCILTAALPFLQGVKVKALEWQEESGLSAFGSTFKAAAGTIGYRIFQQSPKHKLRFLVTTLGVTSHPDNIVCEADSIEAAKSAAQADYEARILSAIAPSPRAQALEEAHSDLNARLKAKGMYSIDEMMGTLPVDKWRVHSGMTDIKFFGEWLERKTREYLTMKAAYDAGDKDERDELYEWVLAHYGAFHDVLVNFRAALSSQPVADGWLPIETAPRDGTIIDLLTRLGTRITDVSWIVEPREENSKERCIMDGWKDRHSDRHSCLTADQFTHWRPLPASPGASE